MRERERNSGRRCDEEQKKRVKKRWNAKRVVDGAVRKNAIDISRCSSSQHFSSVYSIFFFFFLIRECVRGRPIIHSYDVGIPNYSIKYLTENSIPFLGWILFKNIIKSQQNIYHSITVLILLLKLFDRCVQNFIPRNYHHLLNNFISILYQNVY